MARRLLARELARIEVLEAETPLPAPPGDPGPTVRDVLEAAGQSCEAFGAAFAVVSDSPDPTARHEAARECWQMLTATPPTDPQPREDRP